MFDVVLMMEKYLIYYLAAVNLIAFLMMGIDKRKAVKGRWRISEKALFVPAFLGGAPGAMLGMKVFHHKTLHKKFTIGMPLILVLQLALAGYLIYRFVIKP